MERGLYAAASGMLAQQQIQETLAQNIANSNTVGYKHDSPTFRATQAMVLSRLNNGSGRGTKIGELGTGAAPDQVYTNWSEGPVQQTGNQLDASLGANQFFAIQTPQGERYTRAGNFHVDAQGNLLNSAGLAVLNTRNQPIKAGAQMGIGLDSTGNVTANGQILARIKVIQADPNNLTKSGDTMFSINNPALATPAAFPVVRPGSLEQANVNTVQDLVQLITVSRGFDIAQRAVTTQDDMLRHAANELGKV